MFLSALGLAGLGTVSACTGVSSELTARDSRPSGLERVPPTPTPAPTPIPSPPELVKTPLPSGPIYALPGEGSLLAWTADDGADAEVIARYARFADDTGTRLTFFLNGSYPGWTQHAALLAPLVASGQIQLANHTWSHASLESLSDAGIVHELQVNHDFIQNTFGVDARPYYRPPFGYRNERTDAVAASVGYTCPVMWYGSLADSGWQPPETIVALAHEWFLPQHIVIGHLNHLPVTDVFDQLQAVIAARGLTTVTLDDVFVR